MWSKHALPRLTDYLLRGHEIGMLRNGVCESLAGRVMEIGFGSGLNIRWYPTTVTSVSAVEPADTAWRLSERRRVASAVPIERVGLDAQRLDEPDASFDAVLSTFTLCSIPDVEIALAEVRRVLRPGGSVHFLEHGLSPDAPVARWQRRLEPAWKCLGGGCHLTREPSELLSRAGFEVEQVAQRYLDYAPASRPFGWLSLGRARLADQ